MTGKKYRLQPFPDTKALQAAQKEILTNIASQEILILSIHKLAIIEYRTIPRLCAWVLKISQWINLVYRFHD
jgi:hypothetical protein